MNTVVLGSTNIKSNKNAFGALPIQRASMDDAIKILQKAYNSGFTFFDTARHYSDSEEKLGMALSKVRKDIIITTKTMATTVDEFWKDLNTSLTKLQTDYIDIYQFHNPDFCPLPGDNSGLYEAMEEAKNQGKIRFIGITNHNLDIAKEAILSGKYATLQYPFSYLSAQCDIDIVNLCKSKNIGFIAMKALSGGLITRSDAAYAWLDKFDNVLPIWGIQKETELDEFISYIKNPPSLTNDIDKMIEQDRIELAGNFCRGCGYCMPCPVEITINLCARMSPMIRRSPSAKWLSEEGQAMMMNIENCLDCGQCKSKCPYDLDTPNLLRQNLEDYKNILAGNITV